MASRTCFFASAGRDGLVEDGLGDELVFVVDHQPREARGEEAVADRLGPALAGDFLLGDEQIDELAAQVEVRAEDELVADAGEAGDEVEADVLEVFLDHRLLVEAVADDLVTAIFLFDELRA